MNQPSSSSARPAEDLALRQHRERDLRSDEDRGEHRDLAPELTDVRRPEEHDQRGDGRRVEQCDGQLQREAQAEVERHRHRHRHEIDDHDRHDPHDDRQQVRPPGERRRVLVDLEREEARGAARVTNSSYACRSPRRPSRRSPSARVGPAATLRPGHRAPRGETCESRATERGAAHRSGDHDGNAAVHEDVADADHLTDRRRDRDHVAEEEQPVVGPGEMMLHPAVLDAAGRGSPPDRTRRSPHEPPASHR